jgi:DNA-binding response OmpR family regulator
MPKIKILYVEDELFLGKIVKESLESRGFEVLMETDGARVLPLFTKQRPDVCVLDVMLPNKDGFEIAEEIRDVDKDVPILFVTAKSRTEDVVRGFTLGGNDYIRKPFSMEEMIVRIQNTLRSKEGMPSTLPGESVTMGRYQFFWRRQILMLDGVERKLSFRENELLKFIYAGRDRSSTEKISFSCYGEMTAFSIAVTWMCISPSCGVISKMTAGWKLLR